jgi:hypothetical protein
MEDEEGVVMNHNNPVLQEKEPILFRNYYGEEEKREYGKANEQETLRKKSINLKVPALLQQNEKIKKEDKKSYLLELNQVSHFNDDIKDNLSQTLEDK